MTLKGTILNVENVSNIILYCTLISEGIEVK